jgi:transcriptional regulator with XRE-family HTH domain
LDELIQSLRKQGITQKAFAESIGMSSQKLSAIKSSERRNRYFHELGATKLACLWVLERFPKKG